MAATLRIAVLVTLVAYPCLAWVNLPHIPAGRRAEYYLLQNDGAYKYGYDTGTGQSAQVDADPANEVQGHVSYVNKEGQQVSLKYSAGEHGYVPNLDGIPAPGTAAGRAGAPIPAGGVVVPTFPQGPGGQVDPDYDENADASYSFDFDTGSYKRTESSDSRGNIRGQYSYNSREGGSHGLSYVAGEGTGFVVTGTTSNGAPSIGNQYSAPADPITPYSGPISNAQGGIKPDGSYSFSFSSPEQSREESADAQNNVRGRYSFVAKDDGQTRTVDYEAGSATGFVARGSHLPIPPSADSPVATGGVQTPSVYSAPSGSAAPYSGPESNIKSVVNPDGSYSFSFDAGDHSREETADSKNNVHGAYSFRAKDDGKIRRVEYEAGSKTGFVARGDHLPSDTAASSPSGLPISTYSAASPSAPSSPPASYSGPGSEGVIKPDGSYSFSFNTDEQSREESADAQNNVRGSYSFRAKDDGKTRRVDYEAGAATGFIARGDHLPVAEPVVPGSPASQGIPTIYSSPVVPDVAAVPYSGPAANTQGSVNPDGSYSFSYSTDDQSRQEQADANNNVRGSFSFTAKDDGKTRRVDYEAGAATGFIARGDHLPVPPSPGISSTPGTNGVIGSVGPYSAPEGAPEPSSASDSGPGSDGSYSFSYSTADHSRQEESDSKGNVRGSFSFVAKDDGLTRKVDYEAGAEKGFIAKGAHLPVSTDVGTVGSYGTPSGLSRTPSSGPSGSDDGQDNGDSSYSYSYETDSSSKSESSDSQGNVQGVFSYTGGDGITKTLSYTSRGDDGFVASGAHLPQAPSPGSPSVPETTAGVSGINFGRGHVGIIPHDASSRAHAKSVDIHAPGFVLNKYLPPKSTHKFGYIFDSKV